jgi:hypothetical protein
VAVINIQGRRWIHGAFGEVNWVRNLRSTPEASLSTRNREERITTAELSKRETAVFFAEVLTPYFHQLPPFARVVVPRQLGLQGAIKDPQAAGERHPVFEIWPK